MLCYSIRHPLPQYSSYLQQKCQRWYLLAPTKSYNFLFLANRMIKFSNKWSGNVKVMLLIGVNNNIAVRSSSYIPKLPFQNTSSDLIFCSMYREKVWKNIDNVFSAFSAKIFPSTAQWLCLQAEKVWIDELFMYYLSKRILMRYSLLSRNCFLIITQ